MPDSTDFRQFTREQKTGFVLLLVFALLTVGLGLLQMRNAIYGPFVIRAEEAGTNELILDETTRLQQIDTDQDGINDYEELYFYETSPYLPDTDSDGAKDKEELEKGTNPLCVEGKPCESADAMMVTTTTVGTPVQTGGTTPLDVFGAPTAPSQTDAIDVNAVANDPVALRELLRKTGKISEADLAKIDDATLRQFALEVLTTPQGQQDPNSQESP